VRLVREWQEARGVTEGGYRPISKQLGIRRETLRQWVRDADTGIALGESKGVWVAQAERYQRLGHSCRSGAPSVWTSSSP